MKRKQTRFIYEGGYVAQFELEVIETGDDWSPYLSIEDAYKLDDVRQALRRGDLVRALQLVQVFKLIPVDA